MLAGWDYFFLVAGLVEAPNALLLLVCRVEGVCEVTRIDDGIFMKLLARLLSSAVVEESN